MSDSPAPVEMRASAVPADGRAARAHRTREAIVDACVALVQEGVLRPTAPQIAERAGVSVRSVFQHFADLSSLYLAVSLRVSERLALLVRPVDVTLPLDARIDTFVRDRAVLLEAMTPFRRAAQVHGPFSPEIRRVLREGSVRLRRGIEEAFGPELGRLPADDRDTVLDALATATSWAAWDTLRSDWDRSVDGAVAAVARTVRALLADTAV